MDAPIETTFINSRSLQYQYFVSPTLNNTNASAPALMLLHGFPEEAATWAAMIPLLLTLGLKLIVPQMLGYAPTSFPWNPSLYNSRSLADDLAGDLAEILARENVTSVIPIGHDWGGFTAQRFYY
ncbi:Hypothetical protein D9617_8g048950 [Elsinoe fawcettii]|nr:Hypothetical protein D9617_8g048950 [Elsinoe fawcettii]